MPANGDVYQQYSSSAVSDFYRKKADRDEARRALYLRHDREALFVTRNQPRKLPKIGAAKHKQAPLHESPGSANYGREVDGGDGMDASPEKNDLFIASNDLVESRNHVANFKTRGDSLQYSEDPAREPFMSAIRAPHITGNSCFSRETVHRQASNGRDNVFKSISSDTANRATALPAKPRLDQAAPVLRASSKSHRRHIVDQNGPHVSVEDGNLAAPIKDDISDFGSSVDMQASPELRIAHINSISEYLTPLPPLIKGYDTPLQEAVDYESPLSPMFKDYVSAREDQPGNGGLEDLDEISERTNDKLRSPVIAESKVALPSTPDKGTSSTFHANINRRSTEAVYARPLSEVDTSYRQSLQVKDVQVTQQGDDESSDHTYSVSDEDEEKLFLDSPDSRANEARVTNGKANISTNILAEIVPISDLPTDSASTAILNPTGHLRSRSQAQSNAHYKIKDDASSRPASIKLNSPPRHPSHGARKLINTAKPAHAADDIASIIANNSEEKFQKQEIADIEKLRHSLAHIQESKQGIEALEARLTLATQSLSVEDKPVERAVSTGDSNWIALRIPKLWKTSKNARLGFRFTILFWILAILCVVAMIEDYAWTCVGYSPVMSYWEPIDPTRPKWGYATIWVIKRYWRTLFPVVKEPKYTRRPR